MNKTLRSQKNYHTGKYSEKTQLSQWIANPTLVSAAQRLHTLSQTRSISDNIQGYTQSTRLNLNSPSKSQTQTRPTKAQLNNSLALRGQPNKTSPTRPKTAKPNLKKVSKSNAHNSTNQTNARRSRAKRMTFAARSLDQDFGLNALCS